jgi:hypothetical protein
VQKAANNVKQDETVREDYKFIYMIFNLLSLSKVEIKYKVTYIQAKVLIVYVKNSVKFTFEKRTDGLYACNLSSVAETLQRLKYYSTVVAMLTGLSLQQ